MTREHTPGPWGQCPFGLATIIALHDGPDEKGRTHQHFIAQAEGENWRANARLIAAAPRLLSALEAMLSLAEMLNLPDQAPVTCAVARAVIAEAKAEGRSS